MTTPDQELQRSRIKLREERNIIFKLKPKRELLKPWKKNLSLTGQESPEEKVASSSPGLHINSAVNKKSTPIPFEGFDQYFLPSNTPGIIHSTAAICKQIHYSIH